MSDTTWGPLGEDRDEHAPSGPPQDHLPFVPPLPPAQASVRPAWEPDLAHERTLTWETEQDPWNSPVAPVAVPTGRRERGRIGWGRLFLVSLLSGIVGATLAAGVVLWLGDNGSGGDSANVTVVERIETQILTPETGGSTSAAVATRVLPSIVTIEVRETSGGDTAADSSGSGVVISTDGLLVTNHHVVDGAADVRVVFADGRTYEAEIIGSDSLTDIALIRIDAVGLTAVEIGSAANMHIGDAAIAIGSPLGLRGGPSVTVGVVSACDRRVQTSVTSELFGLLQTDAPITRGSSGGALVDDHGRLIGITTAIGVSDVGAEGLGFAVPVEMVMRIVDDLNEFGEARHAFLGIQGTTLFRQAADGATVPSGVVVSEVVAASAASAAGLEPGDIILSFDGDAVTTMEQLVVEVRFYRVGDAIDVVIERTEAEQTIPVILLERPEDV